MRRKTENRLFGLWILGAPATMALAGFISDEEKVLCALVAGTVYTIGSSILVGLAWALMMVVTGED